MWNFYDPRESPKAPSPHWSFQHRFNPSTRGPGLGPTVKWRKNRFFTHISLLPAICRCFRLSFAPLLRERQRRIISAGIYLQLQVTLNLFLVFSSVPSSKSQFIRFFSPRGENRYRRRELRNYLTVFSVFPFHHRFVSLLANAHYTRGLAAENARVTGLAMGKV